MFAANGRVQLSISPDCKGLGAIIYKPGGRAGHIASCIILRMLGLMYLPHYHVSFRG